MKKCLLLSLFLLSTQIIFAQVEELSGPPPAPAPSNYSKSSTKLQRPSNLKVINATDDYGPYHIDKILKNFVEDIRDLDTAVTFYLLDYLSSDFLPMVQEKMNNLNGKESAILLKKTFQGTVELCDVKWSNDLDPAIQKKLQSLDICSKLK